MASLDSRLANPMVISMAIDPLFILINSYLEMATPHRRALDTVDASGFFLLLLEARVGQAPSSYPTHRYLHRQLLIALYGELIRSFFR